jgi:AraC family transcriptional regulator
MRGHARAFHGGQMTFAHAYGDEIARSFRMQKAPSVSATLRPGAFFAATHVVCGEEGLGETLPIPVQPALIVCVLLQPLVHELWLGGKPVPVGPLPVATISVVDLEQEPTAFYGGVLESLQIYFPRDSLSAMANDSSAPMIRDLIVPNGTVDPVAYQLSLMMQVAITRPKEANLLFLSGLMEALYGHLSEKYGNLSLKHRGCKGGLAPWQLARAKELIDTNLSGAVSLSFLATECGMSTNHFARAFKKSIGFPPHRWLLLRRVEVAKGLLESGSMSMSDIASITGFSDQSHFTRVFSELVGVTPRAWKIFRSR